MRALMIFTLCLLQQLTSFACTNIMVTKGASEDSATYLVYTNDGEWLYHLDQTPARDHRPGDSLVYTSMSGKTYKIPQIAHTHAIIGFLMNEHQLAIGETTFMGREELWDKNMPLKYWELMQLALLRATTAREAITVITDLAETYGYGSEGESISIADPNEAWLLEIIGTGGEGGAVWVARKVPDGKMVAHANHARIGVFPLDDPDNCLYSERVISYAIEKGYYAAEGGAPFAFNQVYDPPSPAHLKYTESRVWSIYNRAAPSLGLLMDYHRGIKGAEAYPLFIQPDHKLSLQDVFALVRDHYEGTPMDMTLGITAGPFGNPNRPRPLDWSRGQEDYSWERPISTYNTAFSYVAQLRNYLPDEVGGIAWYGVDDTYTSCYFPIYCHARSISEPFTKGDINHYSHESAWWAFNFVANFAMVRYRDMVRDIVRVQERLEQRFIMQQDSIEQLALSMGETERIQFLDDYSKEMGQRVHQHWVALGNYLVTKYNDGYVKDSMNRIQSEGIPDEWLDFIILQEAEKHKIVKWD